MAKKILAVTSEPVSADALKAAFGEDDELTDAEVLVIAPALNSRFRFWMSDSDAAIERAEEVQEETVERLNEEGIDAAGDTGEADPLQAVQDSLATYPADTVVFFTHPQGAKNWLEDGVVAESRARFDVPIEHMLVEGD